MPSDEQYATKHFRRAGEDVVRFREAHEDETTECESSQKSGCVLFAGFGLTEFGRIARPENRLDGR